MARITKSNRTREHARIREQITSKLDEQFEVHAKQYEAAVRDYEKSQEEQQVENFSPETKQVNPTEDKVVGEFKEVKEMQDFNFDQFGKEQGTGVDPMKDIPAFNDGNAEEAPDAVETKDAKKSKKEDFDLTEVCEEALKGTFTNLQEKAVSVKKLLTENMSVKQFITNTGFGRGVEMSKQKVDTEGKDTLCHFALKTLKPGRAKAVVVSVPRVLAELFEQTRRKSPKGVLTSISDNFENGQLTDEQKADVVDLVMNYDDFCVKVANLMEGVVAEFGGIGGALDTDVTKTVYKVDSTSNNGVVSFVAKDLDAGTVKEMIGGKTHILYQMVQPKSDVLKQLAQDSSSLDEGQRKAIERWKTGKNALKRTKGAFSALYTPENFTSASKFETAKPFGKTPITAEQAKALSAKAVFQNKETKFDDTTGLRLDSYDAQGFNGDLFKVFDPSIKAADRYKMLTVAENYAKKDKAGKVITRKMYVEEKQADGTFKKVQKDMPIEAAKFTLVDRLPKDFFTGKVLEGAELEAAEFVMYGSSHKNKKGANVAPPVLKRRVSFDGLEAEVNETKGIVGTFGLDDASVSKLIELTSEEVAKNAFITAFSRTSTGRSKNEVSAYDDGTVSALMMAINL